MRSASVDRNGFNKTEPVLKLLNKMSGSQALGSFNLFPDAIKRDKP